MYEIDLKGKCVLYDEKGNCIYNGGSFEGLRRKLNENVEPVQNKEEVKIHIDRRLKKELFRQMQSEVLGDFIMCIKDKIDVLSNVLNDSELVKFLYMITYVKKEGYLILDNNKTFIDKKKLKALLDCGDTTFKTFYKKLLETNLLEENDKSLKINVDFFYKGSVKKYKEVADKDLNDYTRLYINTIRNIYINSKGKNKGIAMAYKLLPYVHWRYNILCVNTSENDRNELCLLTIKDVMSILGYSHSKYSKFKKDFYDINIDSEGRKLFASVQKTRDSKENIILVNPTAFYSGSDIDDYDELAVIFGIKYVSQNIVQKLTKTY